MKRIIAILVLITMMLPIAFSRAESKDVSFEELFENCKVWLYQDYNVVEEYIFNSGYKKAGNPPAGAGQPYTNKNGIPYRYDLFSTENKTIRGVAMMFSPDANMFVSAYSFFSDLFGDVVVESSSVRWENEEFYVTIMSAGEGSLFEAQLGKSEFYIVLSAKQDINNNDKTTQSTKPVWQVTQYVDEFERPINLFYVTNLEYIKGVFSNTATNNSLLKVSIIIDYDPDLSYYSDSKTQILLFLYEYGNKQLKSSIQEEFTIKILDTKGNVFETTGILYQDRIFVGGYEKNENTVNKILDILRQPGSVVFYLSSNKYIREYQFTIEDTGNFKDVYASIAGDVEKDTEENINESKTQKIRIKSGSNPNVRSKASADSEKVGNAKSEKIYELLEIKENWYKIRLDDGAVGWISSGMAEIIK